MIRVAMNLAHRIRKLWWRIRKPQTLGVKVMTYNNEGHILLVKPVYASTWQIPGGGVHRYEHPSQAGIREIREETGINLGVDHLTLADVFISNQEGKSDCVIMYTASNITDEPQADGREIEEAAFFPLDNLPPNTAGSVHRRLANESISGIW